MTKITDKPKITAISVPEITAQLLFASIANVVVDLAGSDYHSFMTMIDENGNDESYHVINEGSRVLIHTTAGGETMLDMRGLYILGAEALRKLINAAIAEHVEAVKIAATESSNAVKQ